MVTSPTDASLRWSVNTSTLARRCRRGASTPSHRYREIAARTGGERAQQIDLGEKLQIVALLRRASPHEIHVLTVEPGALEHIQHVVYIELGQSIRSNRASQIGMTVEVKIFTSQ